MIITSVAILISTFMKRCLKMKSAQMRIGKQLREIPKILRTKLFLISELAQGSLVYLLLELAQSTSMQLRTLKLHFLPERSFKKMA